MNKTVYIAPTATVVGDVTLGENVNIWYGAVLRGDSGAITVGRGTNIQDNCVLHEKTTIGDGCTVGHGAIVHGCTIGNRCMVGMGAIVLTGAVIGNDCIIGAGALVTQNTVIPDNSLVLGNPGKIKREVTEEEVTSISHNALHYVELSKQTVQGL